MRRAEQIAQRFRCLDFHDDALIDLRILPVYHPGRKLHGSSVKSIVELCFFLPHWSKPKRTGRVIRFYRCANIKVALDFDVLADNLPPSTSHVDADTNQTRMRRLIGSQELDWGVTYEPIPRRPVSAKLKELRELVYFHVQFFGGVVDVIARRYEVKPTTANNRWRVP